MPADSSFCDACGQPVAHPTPRARARVGTVNETPDPRAYTPKHLVDKILTSRSALEGERKHVTVLFADVRGSMDLAEQVEAEEWHDILNRFFQILAAGVHRFAGAVLLLDRELTEALPLLLDFLGVPDPEQPTPAMDPEARQRRLQGLLRRLVHSRSRREPAVLVMEDLHWIDGASAGFVETLVEVLSGTRTLFLTNFRPEYHAVWMQHSY